MARDADDGQPASRPSGGRDPFMVLSAPLVAEELGIPAKSALGALRELAAAGVLSTVDGRGPVGPGRPRQVFASTELLGLAGSNPSGVR